MNHEEYKAEALAYYKEALQRVATTPPPEGQKYAPGTRVRIADDLFPGMDHFPSGKNATVQYTHAHAYESDDVQSYSLAIDGLGSHAWYYEYQLTPIDSPANP